MRILSIDDLPWQKFPESARRVFLRVDYNVPLKKGQVLDDFRIQKSLPTIKKLLSLDCILILGAHLGRPQKVSAEKRAGLSLMPIAEHLAGLLDHDVIFSEELFGSGVRKLVFDARPGQSIIMLQNLRFHPGEEKNDPDFAARLMEEADVYIDDAFGACHRAHASICAAAQKSKFKAMGYLLKKEWESLNEVLHHPVQPQMAILGGAKIEDKIQLIQSLMKRCQSICLGGRMGLAFLAAEGISLGGSALPKESIQVAKRLIADAKHLGVRLHFPVDGRVAKDIQADHAEIFSFKKRKTLASDLSIFDIGPETIEEWKKELQSAKTIVWNGPMGVFENPVFAEGSLQVVDFLKEHKDSVRSVAGGGETVAAIAKRQALDDLYHVSTGGGAMLEFMEGKKLPGLEVLELREREILEVQEGRAAS